MNINQIMKQASMLQNKMQEVQQRLDILDVTGTSGGGMVKATVSGKGEIKKISIDKSLVSSGDDIEILEDLIVTALKNAKSNADALVQEEMQTLGIPLEMMKLPI
ncbi:YbaB/EbfC family nucleoid-associated protein [Rickettsiales endosymbiont of Peranema trichophorum]|uniref:YbaB/EbfC family nucleoid-associated protein n=1 Tax=Rickettsiales endosymbiont of Peranema trichophorum TaxID=2486577 RepID=UPI001023B79C|nr:YbaB/EbfC family nucleoid-associated protein [Rickettsiales endosymbiont of Peranema trichophorum]RZI45612.1 YbaB/EbfC family nucleoid-associated protein [Rickettsiales endosymbiont of Peranema trichophorum]